LNAVGGTHIDFTGQRIIEPLDKLDDSTLSTSGSADQCDVGTRLDLEGEASEDPNAGAGRVTEVDIFEFDVTFGGRRIDLLARLRLRVDVGDGIKQLDDIGACTLRRGHVGHEGEDISGLNGTKCGGLAKMMSYMAGDEEGKRRAVKPTKNWKVVASPVDTSLDPYQKTRAMTKNEAACENENRA
jgi:hypothetical protein